MSNPSDPTSPEAEAGSPAVRAAAWPKAALLAFGRFWWDFLVGDTPELTVAVAILVGLVALLAAVVSQTLAWIVLPILVLASLVTSTLRGRRRN